MPTWAIACWVYLAFGVGYVIYIIYPWSTFKRDVVKTWADETSDIPMSNKTSVVMLSIGLILVTVEAIILWPYDMYTVNKKRKDK